MFSTRFLRHAVLFAALGLLVAQIVATALMVNRAKDAQIAAALDSLNKIGRSTEAAINRSFVQVDAMLAGLPAVLAPFQRDDRLEVSQVNRVLRELNNQNFTYRDILLIGQDGLPVATALPVSRRRRLPLPSASSFAEVAARGSSVLIGGPVLNANTGEWTLFFARNIVLPTLGPVMAVAEVPVPVVQSILSSAGESLGLRVTLERDDGTLLASVPHDETRIGQKLVPAAAALRGFATTEPIESRFTNEMVFAAVRPTLYPALTVAITLEVNTALKGWYADRSRAFAVSGALGLMIILVAGALMVGLRQRERVEDERATARRTLENALESMSDGFVMFDANDRLIACNSRYKDFYKISAPFIVPGSLFDDIMREGALRGQYPQAKGDIETFVTESKAFHRGNNPPMERLLPDGRWVLITERLTPDGGVVGIRTDITPLKRAMQDLATARDTARAAGEAKSQFLARMSHELRTPLNGILGFSELLLDDPRLQDDQRDKIRTLYNAGKHLLELVNGLLDLSKIEAGRMELATRAFPLQEVIQSSAALVAPDIMRKKLEFTLKLDPSLPKYVLGDATRLRQVMLNLLSNAVKFTPSGGSIYFIAWQKPAERLRVEVRDTGPGISPENQRLIFEDFVQIAPMTQSEALGTGLGLAITSRLVKQMGGEIGYQSNSGAGSTFWIEIPLVMAEMPEVTPELPRQEVSPPAAQNRLRILVVDDVKANRDVAGALLASLGHDIAFASGGAEAIEKLPTEAFDLVLMDLQMPQMDGFEAARAIRAMPDPPGKVPIFALTASVMPDQIAAAQQAGMNGHIGKPLTRAALATALSGLHHSPTHQAQGPEISAEPAPLPETSAVDQHVLDLLRSELKGAAAGVVREFMVEMHSIRDQLAAELAQPAPRADVIAQNAHRLLGAARTLGARRLAEQVTEFQQSQPRNISVFQTQNTPALQRVIAETDIALQYLEASFDAALVDETA